MQTLQRGQKLRLDSLTPGPRIRAGISAAVPGSAIDCSCFGVDAAGKLSDERYFIFYNQKASPCGGISLAGPADGNTESFAIDLTKIPPAIDRLVFVITIDGGGVMSQLQAGHLRIYDEDRTTLAEFPLEGASFSGEKALIAGEFYRKDGWRFAAVGQGFNGGLGALLKHFGGEEAAPTPSQPAPALPPAPPPLPSPPAKITLTKKGESHKVSLTKGAASPSIFVTAKWVDNNDGNDDNDDLDLKAGILYPDGRMSIVHAENLGSLEKPPFIRHAGDVVNASQAAPGEESVHVNPKISEMAGGPVAIVFSVYSAVGNGVVSVASLRPVMKLQWGGQTVECAFDFLKDPETRRKDVYTYVIGIAIIRGTEIEIMPSGMVSAPGSEATAWLAWDKAGGVQITMNGPAVMKGAHKASAALLNVSNPRKYI